MSKKYIIGIDGGSQSTKVVMYDLEGNVVCEGKGLLQPMHTPDADTAEHPDDDLWASLCFAGHDLMSQFAGNKEDIVGIGLGSIRCCRALLKADGTPAAPLISWQDARVTRPYEHTNPDVAYVTSFSGYLTHRLTGEFKDNIANYFGLRPYWSAKNLHLQLFADYACFVFTIFCHHARASYWTAHFDWHWSGRRLFSRSHLAG